MQLSYLQDLLFSLLATYRVALAISSEEGPFSLFLLARTWAEFALKHKRLPMLAWLWRGIGCYYCVSFWLALLLSPSYFTLTERVGVAGGVALLWKLLERKV